MKILSGKRACCPQYYKEYGTSHQLPRWQPSLSYSIW